MKTQLSIQEKLKDLRVERHLTLEQLAAQVPVSKSALNSYETEDFKDISHINLVALAKFYGVSTDYLLGLTENRKQVNTDLAELHLNDETVETLRSGCINNRLLCEIIRHPEFEHLMADIEIYIDGIATATIRNLNDWMETLRTQILMQHHPEENDLYMRTTEKAKIEEEDFFFHVTHEDWEKILRDLRTSHMGDFETMEIEPRVAPRLIKTFQQATIKGNPVEGFWKYFCDELGIPYDKLSEKEHATMRTILKKSKKFPQTPFHGHKSRFKK